MLLWLVGAGCFGWPPVTRSALARSSLDLSVAAAAVALSPVRPGQGRGGARRGGIVQGRGDRGLQPTWSAGLPYLVWIPIDHFLVGRDVRVLHREVSPRIGSDHLPVLVELR